jgi:quinol monooxygenase YgiN
MPKVILQGHIIIPKSDLSAVKAALPNHISLTRQENGCLVFNVRQDADNIYKFDVYEEFTDRTSFAHHQERAGQSEWASVTKDVARHYQITDIE